MPRCNVGLCASIATLAHHGQFRKDGVTPYIEHPKAVAASVVGDPLLEAVAWLHDVLEDTHETGQSLRRQGVPDRVIEAVELLTKWPGQFDDAYYARVLSDPVATRVKISDIRHNLSGNPSPKAEARYLKYLPILEASLVGTGVYVGYGDPRVAQ